MLRFVVSLWAIFAILLAGSLVHARALEAAALNDGQITAEAIIAAKVHGKVRTTSSVTTDQYSVARAERARVVGALDAVDVVGG